ncbi:hypothetical protein [Halorarum salinum]|uniref:Uncharacterized protein n=1 Tax=Halorarum salinum TaxID=2743089 RepID=A0A7D5LA93_9EURY|nr:hypothetical protein [Halobaculum salinum]QLG62006.1 hypothetical protein HUG12_09835 [Halobaculum salinum]
MAVVDAESVPDHVPSVRVLEEVLFLQFSHHADERVRQRAGFSFPVVEDMVLQPYGRIFYDTYGEVFVVFAPEPAAETDKPRAVVVAVEGMTATVITAHSVDDPQQYDVRERYVFLGDYT